MRHMFVGLLVGAFLGYPVFTGAYSGVFTMPLLAEKPLWFEFDAAGGVYGETENGHTFSQTPVLLDSLVRMHKFSVGPVYYYISDRGVIDAPNDLAALSIYFSLG